MAEKAADDSNRNQQPEENAEQQPATEQHNSDISQFRCIVLGAYGSAKQVKVEKKDARKPHRHEIEVTVEACGVNFLDIMMRQGLLDQPNKPPFIMGSECAGMVTAIGESVTNYQIGDRVVVLLETGAWSEKLLVPSGAMDANVNEAKSNTELPTALILPWPATLSASQAAVFGFAYIPAYLLLHRFASVRQGEIVLVHSAGGGVGTAIGQLAKGIPNVTLIGTASKEKHEKLSGLYKTLISPEQDYVAEIKKQYPQGIDVVLDCLSGEELSRSYGILKPLGRHILYGMSSLVTGDRKNFFSLAKHWLQSDRINPLRLHDENHMIGGFCLKSMLFPHASPWADAENVAQATTTIREVWTQLCNLVESKMIDPWIDSEWSFEETKEAMLRLQERKNVGKVVLLPNASQRGADSSTQSAQSTSNQQVNDPSK